MAEVGSEGYDWAPTTPVAAWTHSTLGYPVNRAWLEILGVHLLLSECARSTEGRQGGDHRRLKGNHRCSTALTAKPEKSPAGIPVCGPRQAHVGLGGLLQDRGKVNFTPWGTSERLSSKLQPGIPLSPAPLPTPLHLGSSGPVEGLAGLWGTSCMEAPS